MTNIEITKHNRQEDSIDELNIWESIYIKNLTEYNINEAYVLGKNPTIYANNKHEKPDNRVPIPWAKSAVEDMTGYAASIGNITVDWVELANETAKEEILRKEYIARQESILALNEADIETTELYNQALTQGESYELFWISKYQGNIIPEFSLVENKEIVLVWSKSLKPILLKAVRFYVNGNKLWADIYNPYYKQSWYKILDDKKSIWTFSVNNTEYYPYSEVPLAVYKSNRHSQPLFEAEKAIIDANDNLISKSVNEVDRFNALVAMFPFSVDATFKKKLQDIMVIDNLGDEDKWPEYLEKSLSNISEFYNNLADRLEREYHKTIKVPDFSDENFAGSSSGIALAYKLQGMEFKAALIDPYFNRGLQTRNRLINDVIYMTEENPVKYEMTVSNKRNLPVDEKLKIEVAEKLSNIVSRETLLKYLPNNIVKDADIEIERLNKELMEGIPVNE